MDEAMDAQLDHRSNRTASRSIGGWHGGAALARTAWHRPDIVYQHAMCTFACCRAHARAAPSAPTSARCASRRRLRHGGFLRQLIDWGATPAHLTGTELQQDRLELARLRSAPGVNWHCGPAGRPAGRQRRPGQRADRDLVGARPELRQRLAADMWRILKPGRLVPGVRLPLQQSAQPARAQGHARDELDGYWPGHRRNTRPCCWRHPSAVHWPACRRCSPKRWRHWRRRWSHFVYMVQKER
jgi:hypothetical protein